VAYVPLSRLLPDQQIKEGQALAGAVVKIRGVCRANTLPNRQLAGPPRILVNDLNAFEMLRPPRKDPFEIKPTTARNLAVFRPDPIEARLPVRVSGVVTINAAGRQLHIHDGTGVIQAILMETVKLDLGDRVSVVGYPRPATDPQRLDNAQVRVLGPGEFPPPQPGTPAHARDGRLEGQVVKFTGIVHEFGRQKDLMTITLVADGLTFTAIISEFPVEGEPTPTWVPGSKVEVTGVVTRQPLDGIRRNAFAVVTQKNAITVLETPVEAPPPSWWTGRRVAYLAAGFFGFFLLSGATVTILRIQVRRAAALVRKQYEEKEKLEGQLKLAAKLETVGRLAGGIAHDFNNLLTVINGCAELLEEEIIKNPDQAIEHVAEIQRAGGQAAALTRQLLTFSRQRTVTPHPLDLNAVVTEAAQVLKRLMGDKVTIRVMTEPNLPLAMAESSLLAQILLNLAVNARDAMPSGGTLVLSTANASPGWVRLRASDTGVGMTEEVKAHVFEPFFTTKEVGKGTGLGLSTVYGIVQTLGGEIRFFSDQGRGTTFEVDLPAVGSPDASALRGPLTPLRLPIPDESQMSTDLACADDTALTTPSLTARLKAKESRENPAIVFLVEDDDAVRALATHVLEQAGLTVLTATGSEEAMAVLANYSGPVDLLITDVVMRGLSGRELAEQLRISRPELRVLFMSGYTSDEILLQGVREDQVDFLQKPFVPRELVEQVRRVLGQPV
jgi:signal transduction histidine kinase/CheY-like chemotaxis protein